MEDNKDNFGFGENMPDQDELKERYAIEDDSDTLEPFDDYSEERVVNADDPNDLAQWAEKFQISVQELKDAIVLNGTSVRELKKYLSI